PPASGRRGCLVRRSRRRASMSEPRSPPAVLVVMGVSGSGKTTIANELSRKLGWEFDDGDWFHPAANVEKMHRGIPLTDEDRWPWLKAIARWIDETRAAGRHGIVACSALKRRYRSVLIGDRPDVRLVYLKGYATLIARRMAARRAFHAGEPAAEPVRGARGAGPRRASDCIVDRIQPARNHGADH